MNVLEAKPQKNVLFGITHDRNGAPVIRLPRAVKISIGLPAGPDVEVYMDHDGTWICYAKGVNLDGKNNDRIRYADKATAMKAWPKIVGAAPHRKYPRKLDYITFARPAVEYVPDFDVIEMHGSRPTEVDILFAEDEPLHQQMEMWTASDLVCFGDGETASRSIPTGKAPLLDTPEQREWFKMAQAAGMDRFPIVGQCLNGGCQRAKVTCKPVTSLKVQLLKSLRLGSTAYLHSTSFRTAVNIRSSYETFITAARGRVRGIPLKLVMAPHKVVVEGKTSTAYNLRLEFRPETVEGLRRGLLEAATAFDAMGLEPAPKQIAAPAEVKEHGRPAKDEPLETEVVSGDDDQEEFTEVSAAAIAAEFYPGEDPVGQGDSEDFTEGKTGPGTVESHTHTGSEEAAKAVANLTIEWKKAGRSDADVKAACNRFSQLIQEGMPVEEALRQVHAEDLVNAEPANPSNPKTPPAEPLIEQGQALDMLTYAKDEHGMSANDLRGILINHGHASGDPMTLPKRIWKEVMADLQTPKKPRDEQAPRGRKQRTFEL